MRFTPDQIRAMSDGDLVAHASTLSEGLSDMPDEAKEEYRLMREEIEIREMLSGSKLWPP